MYLICYIGSMARALIVAHTCETQKEIDDFLRENRGKHQGIEYFVLEAIKFPGGSLFS